MFTLQQKLRMIAKSLGIKISKRVKDHAWNGESIAFGQIVAKCNNSNEILAHEICHWIVADPMRRKEPEYGLGQSLWSEDEADQIIHDDEVKSEEIQAAVLEVHLFAAIGEDPSVPIIANFLSEIGENPNLENLVENYWDGVTILQSRNLLSGHWPTCLPLNQIINNTTKES